MSGNKKKNAKPKKVYGTYELDRTEAECRKAQLIRTVLIVLQNALLAIMIFIPTDSFTYMLDVSWLCTLYILVIIALVVTAVYAGVLASRGGKFAPVLSEKYAPGRGLDSRLTFASFELDFLLRAAWAALQIYVTVMAFDAAGSILSCMAATSMLLSFAVRTYTAWFYNGHSRFVPAEPPAASPALPGDSGDSEDFYASAVADEAAAPAAQQTAAPVVHEASEEAEDFYGDGQ